MTAAPAFARTNNNTTTIELDLLDAVLARTNWTPRTVKIAPVTAADLGIEIARLETIPAPVRNRVTDMQRAEITALRATATGFGGEAAKIAAEKCDPYEDAATTYADRLTAAIEAQTPKATPPAPTAAPVAPRREAGPVTGRKAVTPKQWGLIRHLRGRLRERNTAWSRALAKEEIGNDRLAASRLIDRMSAALKANQDPGAFAARKPGARLCSVCFVWGCDIGPFTAA